MKIGFQLFTLHNALWIEATDLGDKLGYESVWFPEHLIMPAQVKDSPYTNKDWDLRPDAPLYDAFTYLGFLACRTSQIRLGTAIYNVGLRHPLVYARAVATLDLLSGGRVDFGIGVSWLEAEWKAVGLDFHTRGRRIDESLEVCKGLWTEPTFEHHGEFFDFDPVVFEPKPVQKPHPPIHIGGSGPASIRRAAALGDGWLPMRRTSLDRVGPAVAHLAELRAEAGRDGKVEVTWAIDDPTVADVERCAEAGIDRLLVKPWNRMREAFDGLRRFADEVLVKVSPQPGGKTP